MYVYHLNLPNLNTDNRVKRNCNRRRKVTSLYNKVGYLKTVFDIFLLESGKVQWLRQSIIGSRKNCSPYKIPEISIFLQSLFYNYPEITVGECVTKSKDSKERKKEWEVEGTFECSSFSYRRLHKVILQIFFMKTFSSLSKKKKFTVFVSGVLQDPFLLDQTKPRI